MWHYNTFVTPQVFQFIGPSNDGRRHGRGTYLFILYDKTNAKKNNEKKYDLSETRTPDASDVGQAAYLLDQKQFAEKYRAKTVFILRW
jgi:hypothetical protein